MPKATAVWLIENTSLTFKQISDFVSIHPFEIQAMADGDASKGILPRNPVSAQQLSDEEIKRCEDDPTASLTLLTSDLPSPKKRLKGPRYTPLIKRAEKPDAIAWLVRHHPMLNDAQIVRLVGTTRPIIQSIRDRSHWNYANIKMRSPVELGMTTQEDLDTELQKHETEDSKDVPQTNSDATDSDHNQNTVS
jgi:hypothetical protein